MSPSVPTATLIVIGDEILSGKFRDENSPWLIDRCVQLGIDLRRIAIVPDDLDLIADEVNAARAVTTWVFTTGGVGPTHDDMTLPAIAQALGQPLVRRPELVEVLRRKMPSKVTDDALRMADLPAEAELWWDGEVFFPQVVCGNVVVFPGVPKLFQLKFDAVAHRFGGVPCRSERLVSTAAEADIAACLRDAQARWPAVHVGSYPRYEQRPWTVVVILDSRDELALDDCLAWLREQLQDQLVTEPDGPAPEEPGEALPTGSDS